MIEILDAGFSYNNDKKSTYIRSLVGISAICEPGTITLICGQSGCGKSTAIRMVNGIIPHFYFGNYTGKVLIEGMDVAVTPLSKLGECCSTVFQNPRRQFFTTEVRSEISFAIANFQFPKSVILSSVKNAAEKLNITTLLDRRLDTLSGGQLQKIACAQVISQQAKVAIFDEPTANLDRQAISDLRNVLKQMKSDGITIIIAEHRLYYLRDLVDQILYLKEGKLEKTFPPAEFFALDEKQRTKLGIRNLEYQDIQALPASPSPAQDSGLKGLEISNLQARNIRYPSMFFPAGKITAVTGINGTGKTTLAHVLCGFIKPKRGARLQLCIRGDTKRRKLKPRDCFIVMQDVRHQLFAERVDKEASVEILRSLDLDNFAKRHPLSLSGGQQQRLVIGTALMQKRNVFIFDEPTSGVDLAHLLQISKHLRNLADQGYVVIVISHDTEFINSCADYCISFDRDKPINQ